MSELNKLDMVDKPIKKKKSLKAYSRAEDSIILELVTLYPDNLAHAFAEAASRLKTREERSIASRYHYMVRAGKVKSPVLTGSSAGFSANKTTKRMNGKFKRKEPLQPLIVIFKQLLECDPIQRKKISEFLKSIE
jgi:hypothetical protein